MNGKKAKRLRQEMAITYTVEGWDKTFVLVPEDFSKKELVRLQRQTKRKTRFVDRYPFEKPNGFERHRCIALDKPPGSMPAYLT